MNGRHLERLKPSSFRAGGIQERQVPEANEEEAERSQPRREPLEPATLGVPLPFTPLHVGPGLLLKSGVPEHLSVVSYAAANVAVDLEPLYYLSRHEGPIHRLAHTFLAAGLIGALLGIVLAALTRRLVRSATAPALNGEIAVRPVILGGLLGGLTHPLLDGLLYTDIRPFAPFTLANPLLGIVPLRMVIIVCVVTGILGGVVLFLRRSVWKVVG